MRKIAFFSLAAFFCFWIFSLTANQEIKTRFPQPAQDDVKEADQIVEQLGIEEVFSQSPTELAVFMWDLFKRGHAENFCYYNSNPKELTPEQATKPATILLHSYGSNQGEWLPLLQSINEKNNANEKISGPIFTIPYPEKSSNESLRKRIEQIRELYLKAGQNEVAINLVGHSLGGIASAEYTFDPQSWVEGTHVQKIISIAGRLKNIEPPRKTPLYGYCYMLLPFIDSLWGHIEEYRDRSKLYAIAAADDWLVPQESVLVAEPLSRNAIVPNSGHALIARKRDTAQKVIQWLFEDDE